MQIKFFSQNRPNKTWGSFTVRPDVRGTTTVFNAPKIVLDCKETEKICFGAYQSDYEPGGWGVGQDGSRPCNSCCSECINNWTTLDLQARQWMIYPGNRYGGTGCVDGSC